MKLTSTRRGFLAGIGGALLTPTLSARAAPLDKVRAAGVLRVAVYQDFEPWAWTAEGRLTGIDVDIGKALADRIGVKVDYFDLLAGEDVEEDLRNAVWRGPIVGKAADVMMHVPYDRQFALRNDRVVIVAPYYREGFALACGREVDCEAPPPHFKGRRLVAELDSIPDFYLSGSFGGVLRNSVSHLPSGMAALNSVRAGSHDIAMATRAQVEHAMTAGGEALVARKGPLPALSSPGWDIAIAVKDDSRDLGDQIDTLMADLRRDGTLARIFATYGVSLREPLAS